MSTPSSPTAANAAAFARMQTRVKPHDRVFAAKVFDLTEQLNAVLAQRGMTRRDLARLLGKHDSEISRWLSGVHNLTFDSLAKLEAALETDLLVTPTRPQGYFGRLPSAAVPTTPAQTVVPALPSATPPALYGAAIASAALHEFLTEQLRSGGQQFTPAPYAGAHSAVSSVVTNG